MIFSQCTYHRFLPYNNTASSLTHQKQDRLVELLLHIICVQVPPGGLAPVVAPGGMSSLVASKVAWLPPGGWRWVLVATSGSCGRWVLVGVMQIPDTGHGPDTTRLHTPHPPPYPPKKLVQVRISPGKVSDGLPVRFSPSACIRCEHNWRYFAGWGASAVKLKKCAC